VTPPAVPAVPAVAAAHAAPCLAVGLMSGTSLDGIDAALLLTDGEAVVEAGTRLTSPYPAGFRERLRGVLGGVGDVPAVERELTDRHAEAVLELLARAGVVPGAVRVVGFHGHTVLHRPREGRTWQIGDGARLAAATGIDVVADFRGDDVAAGGEGAPLAPVYHAALVAGSATPLAVLNLGGVGNVTWIGPDGTLLAFDTGPGNALLDDWALRHTGEPCDRDGRLAAAGRVDGPTLADLLRHPFFAARPPKSLDRLDFDLERVAGLDAADGAATLARFTAAAVAQGMAFCPDRPLRCLVTGGGRHNPTLMAALAAELGMPVDPIEAINADGDALEAQAFAYMAVRSLRGLPLSFPTTTGVPRPLTGGRLFTAG